MATPNLTQIAALARLEDAQDWLASAELELAQGEDAQDDVDAALGEIAKAQEAVESARTVRVRAQSCPAFARQQAFLSQWG